MGSRLQAVSFVVTDASPVAAFWAALLDREVVPEPGGALVPGDERQVGLRFVSGDVARVGPHRLHLHLTSSSAEDQRRTVDTALRHGGRHLDVGQQPDEEHVVLADPGGDELCVIEPGNRFLAGTGPLGEVTCEGSRATGLFWRDALGWELVWDEDGETAVQSPAGGTKVSWGGEQPDGRPGPDRQRLDLVTDDLDGEVERLVGLGATRVGDLDDGVELADPDGWAFGLRRGAPRSTGSR